MLKNMHLLPTAQITNVFKKITKLLKSLKFVILFKKRVHLLIYLTKLYFI